MADLLSRLKLHLSNIKSCSQLVLLAKSGIGLSENWIRYILPGKFKPRLTDKFPAVILCEVTNRCNLSCSMCFNPTLKRTKGFMDMELYRKIVDEVSKHQEVFFQPLGSGEPLLHPKFPEMLEYAKSKKLDKVGTTTNAMLLTPEMTDRIIHNLDVIFISLDSNNKKVLEKVRKGSDYDKIVSNLDYFLKKKKKLGKPYTILNFVLMEETKNELEEVKRVWGDRFDNIQIFKWHSWIRTVKGEENDRTKLTGFPCYQLWHQTFICWDGSVNLCCKDPEAREVMGQLNKQSLYEVWHGERYKEFRKRMITDNLKGTVCAQCDEFWKWPFQK